MEINKDELMEVLKVKMLCDYLNRYGISYERIIRHKRPLSCDDSIKYYQRFSYYLPDNYKVCKNLLIHESKGDRVFLVIVDANKQIDLKLLRELLDSRKLEFSCEEDMKRLIHTEPGNVSLFNIMFDSKGLVSLIIDIDLLDSEYLVFHPLCNRMSIFMKTSECLKFMDIINHEYEKVNVPSRKLIK